MGNDKSFHEFGDKSPGRSNGRVPNHSHWTEFITSKRPYSEMEKSITIWICDGLGITSAMLGWINNLDNVKSTILFILGTIYFMVRIYFMIMERSAALRKERFEQRQRESAK